ncbi:unnamed protein product [Schistosoma rodhaini]|uniref:Polycystin cation channel PKD1/PKD2 domain-containing protein n=1 Tax=Schistosoma rodhaini TaxID=6188 RepID=A0AA85GAU9_9TREM|nr:unnamed protein product [Schistosoma rodhaini]
MSKRFKKEKIVENTGHTEPYRSSDPLSASIYRNQSSLYQSDFERNDNNVDETHLIVPPCLHLPPSYIPHMNHPDSSISNNDNTTTNKHGSQGVVEKVMLHLVKYFNKPLNNPSHEHTNCNYVHTDSAHEERPLISDHDECSGDHVYPTAATVAGASTSSPTTEDGADSTASTFVNPNEVESWMRRRLYYHFMTPVGKFHAKRRIPFKLFVQILKVLLVTIQLIEFGFYRAAHVSFGDVSHKAFCHLYLRQWDSQYETLDYPPATGDYAVYTINDFYEHVGYTITQFNKTKELAIGGYMFDSLNRTMKLCMRYVSPTTDENKHPMLSVSYIRESEKCISIEVNQINFEQLTDGNSIKTFLRDHKLDINFNYLLGFDIHFNLLSPPIYQLDWTQSTECYRFMIKISLENPSQSGQMKIMLRAPYASTPCIDISKQLHHNQSIMDSSFQQNSSGSSSSSSTSMITQQYNDDDDEKKYQLLVHFWNLLNSTLNQSIETKYILSRRLLVILIDSCTLILGIISCLLCIRSIIQGFRIWLETVEFFKNWFGIQLNGVFWEFVRPWILFIIVNDLVIITTSIYALSTLNHIQVKYEPLTYLMGIGALLVWIGILYYVGFSYDNSLLIRTISRSIPGLLRFCVCALILFFAFSLCGWVVLGPYNLKFRTFMSTVECLYSLINGDDMFVTFTIINNNAPIGIYLFSRLFLYLFITLFIYVVLNLFVTIIFEAYEEVKDMQNTHGRSNNSPLWHFVCQQYYNPKSTIFKEDDTRPDRHLLYKQALGYTMTTTTSVTKKSSTDECKHSLINRSQFPQQQRRRLQHEEEEEGKERFCYCYRHRQQLQSHQNQPHSSQNHNDNNTIQNSSNLLNNSIIVDNLSNQTAQLQQGIEQTNNNDDDHNHVNNVRNRMIERVNEMTTTDESIISLNSRSVNV